MRKRMIGIVLAAAVLAACGGDAGQGGAAGDAAVVDSGMAPTPALDSVGGITNSDPGRSD
jgi:ABC-type glycerol-3-phosphate transport system substrate-binding protein